MKKIVHATYKINKFAENSVHVPYEIDNFEENSVHVKYKVDKDWTKYSTCNFRDQ